MTALKVIPWSDVIDAAPGVVKGARKIFARSQQTETSPTDTPPAATANNADLQQRVVQLETRLARLAEQQQAAAKLVETLAEQNARIVEVVDILRVRTRLLIGASAVLAVLLVAAAATVALGGLR